MKTLADCFKPEAPHYKIGIIAEKAKLTVSFERHLERMIEGMSPIELWAFRGMLLANVDEAVGFAALKTIARA